MVILYRLWGVLLHQTLLFFFVWNVFGLKYLNFIQYYIVGSVQWNFLTEKLKTELIENKINFTRFLKVTSESWIHVI